MSPRIYSAGLSIAKYADRYEYGNVRYAATPEGAQQVVDLYAKNKPDVAKIIYNSSAEQEDHALKYLIDELHSRGLKSAVHAIMSWQSTIAARVVVPRGVTMTSGKALR